MIIPTPTKSFISFSPRFSPVLAEKQRLVNRFNGLPRVPLKRIEHAAVRRKTVETVTQI
jgi:hypothetical protein